MVQDEGPNEIYDLVPVVVNGRARLRVMWLRG
jgi:hypothetical protein